MKGMYPEEYGLTGREMAAVATVKFYVGEVEGTRAELETIMDNGRLYRPGCGLLQRSSTN